MEEVLQSGKSCILDIEMEGVQNVKKSGLNGRYVFIKPPSVEALEQRLRGRGSDRDEDIRLRLEVAKRELEFAETGFHDKVIVNDDLEQAFRELEHFCMDPNCT